MVRRLFGTLLIGAIALTAIAADEKVPQTAPKQIGIRNAVLEFTLDENAKASAVKVVSTEALALSELGEALLKMGKIKPDSPGVTKLSESSYRLQMGFPVKDDGALLADTTLPVPQIRQTPAFPFELSRTESAGGVLLRLTIDEKGKMGKVECVRASHPGFIAPTIQAFRRWTFSKPAMRNGVPIAITVLQLVTFETEGKGHAPLEWRISPEPAFEVIGITGAYIRL